MKKQAIAVKAGTYSYTSDKGTVVISAPTDIPAERIAAGFTELALMMGEKKKSAPKLA